MRSTRFLFFLALLLAGVPAVVAQSTTRVSVDSLGGQGMGASAGRSAMSPDGRFIAFQSQASNLAAGDNNGVIDVFLRDTLLGATELVSVTPVGVSGNSGAYEPCVSADGRYVAFTSSASDLVAVDANGTEDVFLRDRLLGTTTIMSVSSSGQQGNGWSGAPTMSGDGQVIAFLSGSTNLGGSPTGIELYVRDLAAGTTTKITSTSYSGGGQGPTTPVISADGRYVAYQGASLWQSGWPAILVFDRQTNSTALASITPGGAPVGTLAAPSISGDGRFVAFASNSSNFVPNDTGYWDVFVTDMQALTVERVSVAPGAAQANGDSGDFGGTSISLDGRFVAFNSVATDLVSGDTNGVRDIFVCDRQSDTTERVSVTSTGVEGNDYSAYLALSADGRLIACSSRASNLVAGDTNGLEDIFLRDRGTPPPVPYCVAKTNSLGCVPAIGYSGLPSMSGPDNFYVTASNVLNQKSGMMLWAGAQANIPFHGGVLCLAAPIVRTPLQNSGGSASGNDCSGSYSYHFTQAYMAGQFLSPGSTVCCQFWSRDPGFAVPNNIGLTDGLQFVIGP